MIEISYTRQFVKRYNKNEVTEYAQNIPQSHTADEPTASYRKVTDHKPSHDIRKTIKVKQPALVFNQIIAKLERTLSIKRAKHRTTINKFSFFFYIFFIYTDKKNELKATK